MPLRWLLARHMGSPPLTRERLEITTIAWATAGITPAYAGKTLKQFIIAELLQDHPRLRGKDNINDIAERVEAGSPPLTRERQSKAFRKGSRNRITPAYAGKTYSNHYLPIYF